MEVNKKKHPQGGESLPTTSNQANAPSQDHIITLEGQMSLFDAPPLKVHKPVRLIELFSGIGSQAKALQRLGVEWESWGAYDIDPYAVKAYNAIFGTDYVPTDICKMTADDLKITDRDKYTYILTYSFPCQDLSIAGQGKGMKKGSGTRSGLLWEVERLLHELGDNLPQVLVMENVKQVINHKNKRDFDAWRESLRIMGYDSQHQVLNAKDYGVAQNRERCFMVSWLGEYSYEFPNPIPLKKRLKDYLESEVDDKFYLTDEQIATFVARTEQRKQITYPIGEIRSVATGKSHQWGSVYSSDGTAPTQLNTCWKFPTLVHEGGAELNQIGNTSSVETGNESQRGRVYGTDGISPALMQRDYKDPVRIGWND